MFKLNIDTLFRAIKEKVNISLRQAVEERGDAQLISKFLNYDTGKNTIMIDFPVSFSAKTKDRIVVQFIFKDNSFFFYSEVLDFTLAALPGEEKKEVIEITIPDTIYGKNRREFFKVSTPRLVVEIEVIENKEPLKNLTGKKFEAVARNISGGGVAIEKDKKELPLSLGDVLDLHIHIPDQEIYIQGEVVNKYQCETSSKMIFGIKFIQWTIDKLNFKRSVNRIMRYVMKRERELLVR